MSTATATATAAEKVYWANVTLRDLVDNGDVEDAADYRVTCDECATLITSDYYDEHDGLCDACHASVHATCGECGGEFHLDEMSDEFPKLCVDCGCEKHTAVADELWEEITDHVGSWSGEDDEIARLKKLLAYAKRLK